MKKLTVFLVCMLPAVAFAESGFGDAFTAITGFITDAEALIFEETPSLIERFWAWAIQWYVKARLYGQYEFMKMSWNVAKVILSDLSISSQIQTALTALPADLAAFVSDTRMVDALNVVLNAHVTRFVMRLL